MPCKAVDAIEVLGCGCMIQSKNLYVSTLISAESLNPQAAAVQKRSYDMYQNVMKHRSIVALSSLEKIRSHPAGAPTASWSMSYPNGVVSQPTTRCGALRLKNLRPRGGTKAWQGAWCENIRMLMLVIQMLPNCRQWRHADGVPQGGWKGG